MATKTNDAAATTPAKTNEKPVKEKKPPVPAAKRLTDNLKRVALQGKVTKNELKEISELAIALQHFAAN